jgi:hypothetical protein
MGQSSDRRPEPTLAAENLRSTKERGVQVKPAFPFPGTPAFNTIDYFVVVLLLSLVAAPLSCLSRNRAFQSILTISVGSACLFSVAPRLLFF